MSDGGLPAAEALRPIRWSSWLGAVVIAVGALAYLNSFSGVFLLDDGRTIIDNPAIRGFASLWGRRPTVNLTLAVNYRFGRLDVWGYHLTNLTVHVLAAITLFGIVGRTLLLEPFRPVFARSAHWIAAAVALVWVVHPLQTQSVTYVIQRSESMAGLFYLLTLYCTVRGAKSKRSFTWYTAAVVACALGMGSKAIAITAPVIVFLYDRTFISRSFRQAMRRRWALYVALAATWSVLLACGVLQDTLDHSPEGDPAVGFGFKAITPLEYALTQPGVVLHYLKLSFWPHPLCLDYGWPTTKTVGEMIVPGLVIGILVLVSLWALVMRNWLGFVGAWFFVILSPTSSFVPIKDPAFEHRMYLPLAAVVVVVVITAYRFLGLAYGRVSLKPSTSKVITGFLLSIVVAALGLRTIRRNEDYRSTAAMWGNVVAQHPENARAQRGLGMGLAAEDRLDEAIVHYRKSLGLDPDNFKTYNSLGNVLLKRGEVAQAVASYARALELNPGFPDSHGNMGVALVEQDRISEAMPHLRQAVNLEPHDAKSHYNLADALASQGMTDDAIIHYTKSVELDPDWYEAHNNLGNALLSQHKFEQAIAQFKRAMELDPTLSDSYTNIGVALARQGKIDEATPYFTEAVKLEPDSAEARMNLGETLALQGMKQEAAQHYSEAIRSKPDFVYAHSRLAALLREQGRTDEAIASYQTALRLRPNLVAARFDLGRILAEQGRLDEAMREFRQVFRDQPGHRAARQAIRAARAQKDGPG